jgi:hypothetical protein
MRYLFILMVAALVVVVATSCKNKEKQVLIDALAPVLVDQVDSMLRSPEVQASLGKDSLRLMDIAIPFILPRVQNEIAKLASGTSDEQLSYERIQRLDPELALMIYRVDDNGLGRGLWPRLEAFLVDRGYIVSGSHLQLSAPGRDELVGLSRADKDDLIALAGPAIFDEYQAVRALQRTPND